jgi:uncharacterized protein YecE (DUF72 family)
MAAKETSMAGSKTTAGKGRIVAGIGGWTFAPWRGTFYPAGLPHKDELDYAVRRLTAIEINGTFYRSQSPASFRKWAAAAPDGFLYSLKAPRFSTNRRVLGEAGESIERFVKSGIAELGPKLGPILWQFAPTKKFEPDDFAAFLALLPAAAEGVRLRHAVEVRHDSFLTPDFIALVRQAGVAVVLAESEKYPLIADLSADFVYLRLQKTRAEIETGYDGEALARWAARARSWAAGAAPDDLPYLAPPARAEPRDVFAFMISGAKVRAPAAAMAFIERVR